METQAMTKSKLLTTTAGLTLICAALISTQGFARGGEDGRRGHAGDSRMTLLERLDSNADDVLSLDEFSNQNAEKAQRHFDKMDANGDALLSSEEFSGSGKRRHHPKLDTLDTSALDQCLQEILGYELPARPDHESRFAAADITDDGSVDLDEFLVAGELRAEERFAVIDGDGDGQLTGDEIDAFEALRKEQRDAHRTCVGEQLDEDRLLN
jgi:hypothetical protein